MKGKAKMEEKRELILEMYNKGHRISDIMEAASVSVCTVYKYIEKAAIKKRYQSPTTKTEIDGKKAEEAITREEIAEFRRKCKVGDVIWIKTLKASADGGAYKSLVYGALRKAKIVDISNKRHCLVELECGVRESVLWSELVMEKRKNERKAV